MIDIWATGIHDGPQYTKNTSKGWPSGKLPCLCCGRFVPQPVKNPVRLFGGNLIVTQEEAEKIIAEEGEGGDLGFYPIGSECLKKYPELKMYVEDARKNG